MSIAGSRDSLAGALDGSLLKLRAVLILLAAPRGAKASTATSLISELQGWGVRASQRSLYFWRSRYLRSGFAGIARQRRSDCGRPKKINAELFAQITDVAANIRRHGDIAREFRHLQSGISSETFRFWVQRIRDRIRQGVA